MRIFRDKNNLLSYDSSNPVKIIECETESISVSNSNKVEIYNCSKLKNVNIVADTVIIKQCNNLTEATIVCDDLIMDAIILETMDITANDVRCKDFIVGSHNIYIIPYKTFKAKRIKLPEHYAIFYTDETKRIQFDGIVHDIEEVNHIMDKDIVGHTRTLIMDEWYILCAYSSVTKIDIEYKELPIGMGYVGIDKSNGIETYILHNKNSIII